MSLKTKHKDKLSQGGPGGRPAATTKVAPTKSDERTENVYEKKG